MSPHTDLCSSFVILFSHRPSSCAVSAFHAFIHVTICSVSLAMSTQTEPVIDHVSGTWQAALVPSGPVGTEWHCWRGVVLMNFSRIFASFSYPAFLSCAEARPGKATRVHIVTPGWSKVQRTTRSRFTCLYQRLCLIGPLYLLLTLASNPITKAKHGRAWWTENKQNGSKHRKKHHLLLYSYNILCVNFC